MTITAALVFTTAKLEAPAEASSASPGPALTCPQKFHQSKHASYARAVFKRDQISKRTKKRLVTMRVCQHSDAAHRNARRLLRKLRKRREARLATTPFGAWAIPARIVMCESKGNFRAKNSSSTAGGAYQILDSTWYAHGGSRNGCRHPAACAPPSEQHKIARRIWNSGGASQWQCA